MSPNRPPRSPPISRLVLWNIDPTLVDVVQVTRAAYAEAFEKVTGQPLVYLTATAGMSDSEIFHEFLARNDVDRGGAGSDDTSTLFAFFTEALQDAFAARRTELAIKGRVTPGAREALAAVGQLPDTVQTFVTGTVKRNALAKLSVFALDKYLDIEIGGHGSQNYPKASLIQFTRMRAEHLRQRTFPEAATVYVTDSIRDVEAACIGRAKPIAIVGASATRTQLTAAGAEYVVDTLEDLGQLLDAIQAAAPIGV